MGMPEKMFNDRLFPVLPPEGLRAFCFYPMSKRRGDVHNWYSLAFDDRKALMRAHGTSGRTFAGRIVQVGTPHEVYERPATRLVADFIGDATSLPQPDGRWLARRP